MIKIILPFCLLVSFLSCNNNTKEMTTEKLLGNANYQAICYGGYRTNSRDLQPTKEQIKEDLKILSAMNIKFIRTYNVHFSEAKNILEVIAEMKKENPKFEMYVMLGAWIDCKNAWTGKTPIHEEESERNETEIAEAVRLANQYPDIVKVIAVGNEAMVKWAGNYFVQPTIILKWVNHLQNLKKQNKLSKDVWITSSDDFAAWGGGEKTYQTPVLDSLIKAVDYVSMHTYPMHNTYYNPEFWFLPESEKNLSDEEKINHAMQRAIALAQKQYADVAAYVKSVDSTKTIHIGESGWTTVSDGLYGEKKSRAADEYKAGIYYKLLRTWTNKEKISCFYFEAFDENWKDQNNPQGSENHFGIFNLQGQAKYAVWDLVDKKVFDGLQRDGNTISKTNNGDEVTLKKNSFPPPTKEEFKK